jgi:hypothetical protein
MTDQPPMTLEQAVAVLHQMWAREPDVRHCFAGSDDDLIRTAQGYLAREARQR